MTEDKKISYTEQEAARKTAEEIGIDYDELMLAEEPPEAESDVG